MSYRVHIDCFTSLDDIPKKLHGDRAAVKSALLRAGRFSCFEMDGKLGATVTALIKSGEVVKTGGQYPWTTVAEPKEPARPAGE